MSAATATAAAPAAVSSSVVAAAVGTVSTRATNIRQMIERQLGAVINTNISATEYRAFLKEAPPELRAVHSVALEASIEALGFKWRVDGLARQVWEGFVARNGYAYRSCPAIGCSETLTKLPELTDADAFNPLKCSRGHRWWGWSGGPVSADDSALLDFDPGMERLEFFLGPDNNRELILQQLTHYINFHSDSPDTANITALKAILARERAVEVHAATLIKAETRAAAKRKGSHETRIGVYKRRRVTASSKAAEQRTTAAAATTYACPAHHVWKRGCSIRFRVVEVECDTSDSGTDDDDDDDDGDGSDTDTPPPQQQQQQKQLVSA